MIYAVVIIGAILFVPLLVMALVSVLIQLPKGASYSDGETVFLWVSGFVAGVVALVLLRLHGDGWWLIPAGAFVSTLLGTKSVAVARRDRKLEAERRRLAEHQKRVEQRKQRERERVERLGKDGVKTLARMQAAVTRIGGTEAAREGWLGDANDISFSADLRLTEDQLAQIVTFRAKITEAKRLPHSTDADKQLVKEAETATKNLEMAVRERIRVIEGCVRKAEEVDETLRAQRQRAEVAQQRDELRGQLAVMLSGVELTSENRPSDSADAVTARVEAFRELKDSINLRAVGPDGASEGMTTESSWRTAMSRLRPW